MQKRNLVKVLFAGLALAAVVTSLTSCKKELTDTPLEGMQLVADFSEGKQKTFFPSDGWTNGDPFNVTWTGENVKYDEDGAKLSITEDDKFYGAELRSTAHYWYGDYEITMKPEPKKGTCSSFFVYTGPSEIGEDGNPNPHDEIDIEFLGKDTTHVQFNFFVNGKGGNEYKYDLGFDASEEFHTYGFRWTDSYITWYVDGKPVYRVDETPNKPLPKTPGRMMMNYWCGTQNAELWMGKYSHPVEGEGSYYKIVKTSAEAIVGESADADIDWPVLSPLSDLVAVPGDDKHVVTTNGSEYNVVYTDNVGATYTNVKFELNGAAEGKNYLHLMAKNNGTESASIRVDVFGEATNKTVNNSTVCNVAATMDGIEVSTDLNWGGSTFNNIPAGETVEIVVYYEGIADSIQIMFHTHIYGDTDTHSGDITISDIKFALYGELKLPEGNDDPLAPTLNINGVEKEFAGNLDSYILTKDGNNLTISYTDLAGNCYHNVNAPINDVTNKNQLTLNITNNGSAMAKVRIDVNSNVKVNNTTASNTSATMNGVEVWTDTDWGGSSFDIAAGQTATCVINFDNSRGLNNLMFFIESSRGDAEVYTGSITLSEVTFDYIPGENGEEPLPPVVSSSIKVNGVDKTYEGNLDKYTVAYEDNKATVSYANIAGNGYTNVNFQIADIAQDKNYVTFVLTNNGSEAALVRVDINTDTQVGNHPAANIDGASMDGAYVWTDLEWGGTTFTVAAGATVTCVVKYDNTRTLTNIMFYLDSSKWDDEGVHTGSVTINEISFALEANNEGSEPVEGEAVALEFITAAAYQITNNAVNKANTVVYEGIMDSTWQCISANIQAVVADNNKVSLTFTNNGEAAVIFRLDVGYENAGALVSQITNVSAGEYNSGEKNVTFTVETGQELTIVVEFDTTTPATGINIFIDSSVWKEEADRVAHSGNVTISNVVFSK